MYDIKKRPLGIYEKALPNDFTWLEKMQAAKQAGFDYIEISVDESDERLARLDWSDEQIEEIRSYMKETGIIIPSMCLSGHRRFPFGSKNKEIRDKAFEIMEKGIILAQKLGVRVIQLATYDVYYEESDEETKALFLEGMKKSVEMASHAGVILAMEIMDTPFVGTILRAMHYIKEIRSPYFKIYPDMGNLTQFSADVESEFELGISETVAIHVKETNPGVFKCVPFGEGTVRFTDIFKKLKDLNYTGMFLIEMWADNTKKQTMEDVVHGVFLLLGLITVGCVLLITVYLIVSGLPAIMKIGLGKFLFGSEWASTAADPKYGILPFILTSVYGTCGAILIGVPIGFLTAVFLSKMAPGKLRSVMESAVSLLAGIPSVVYGLVGMLVLVPGIRKLFHVPDGASLLAAVIVLAIMILPSIIKVSVNALDAVPKEYEDASLALGATPVETWFRVSAPAARSGIAAAVVLGVGRAIGEAMAVMMVSGNAPNMPSLFESVRFLTTAVASEMSYASGLQRQALFSIALVLYLFIMLINAALNFFLKRKKE